MPPLERLKTVYLHVINEDADLSTINESTQLVEDLNCSSIELLYMALALEEEFGVSFSNDAIFSFRTVGDVLKLINMLGGK